jgi:uncharacterized membrane protein
LSGTIGRRRYLDWARGVAVLIMIQAHLLDSWTRLDARGSWQFVWAMIVAGFGAPMFLFLAGTAVALSAGSKARRSGDIGAAARAVMTRGGWIFLLAFVFRIQAWILGWGATRTLLKVDILNIMGPAIAAAAALWGAASSARARVMAAAGVAVAIALLTPLVRATSIFDPLPNAIEAYLRPVPGVSNFYLFPWAGFVFVGAAVGVLLDAARTQAQESRLNVLLAAVGTTLALGAYAASFLPTPYAHSGFWTSSPAFFLLRSGVLILLVPAAYAWDNVAVRESWSPIQQLGRSSLFIYWIHVEMVYGLISLRLHKTLTHPQAWGAYGAFVIFMLGCSLAKDRVLRWWNGRGQGTSGAARPAPAQTHDAARAATPAAF